MNKRFFLFLFFVVFLGGQPAMSQDIPTNATSPVVSTPTPTPAAPAETKAPAQKPKDPVADLYSQIELFSYALTTVQSEYVDEKTPQDLIYGSLKGMLGSLDPHSQFLDPEEYAELKTETEGKFGGLGIEISIRDGLLTVIAPIEDSPAWKVGIKAGDRIVRIEKELTKDLSLTDAVKRLRGDPGTEVNVTILREDEYKIHQFKIVREVIKVQDVKDTQILEDKIGYLRLTEFREESSAEFHAAIQQLKTAGADSLILDLRNNPGGLLNVAIQITEEFLPKGDLIVSTRGRRESQNADSYSDSAKDKVLDWPMVVLINEGSASGSEILAGALKDHGRAVLVGTKSFGKGSVQSVVALPDGSGLRLTTSKYFTPSGVSIHGTGITPDVVIKRVYAPKKPDEQREEEEKLEKIFSDVEEETAEDPALTKLTQEQREARQKLLEDNQVQAALNVIKGIKIYRAQNKKS